MSAGKMLMQAGGAVAMVGTVGMVTGAAMLAFSSAFSEASANAVAQSSIALWVAVGGAALSIAGLAIVCIGLVVRPSRAEQHGRLYVPVHQRDSFMRTAHQRGRSSGRRGSSVQVHSPIPSEQPVVAGSA
ncbi:hypothetical protein [Agromyces sp. NPDC056965]|uniref:hypothetical protein n=1 Tax=Agromyces sp. NPDC056965 TaxID=3345983 RepID=UPI003634157D